MHWSPSEQSAFPLQQSLIRLCWQVWFFVLQQSSEQTLLSLQSAAVVQQPLMTL